MTRALLLALLSASALSSDLPGRLSEIGFDQNIGAQLPLDLKFQDEHGRDVELRDYFGKRPVLIALVYHNCPMLCSAELGGLVTCLRAMKSTLGRDFDVLTVSFDPEDTPQNSAKKKSEYLHSFHHAEAQQGWHFLTGKRDSIDALTNSLGFRYTRDLVSGQYMHASGITLLTPEGRISKYYFGIEYYPRDLEFGLIEASQGKVGTITDQALLYCYRYDPATGKYGLVITKVLRLGGLLTLLGLGTFLAMMHFRERKHG